MRDGNDRRYGDRERRSWRDVDQTRGKSRGADRDGAPKPSSPAALAAQKSYRAALERAFEAGTLGELAKTLTRPEERASPITPSQVPHAGPHSAAPNGAIASVAAPASFHALPPAPPVVRDPERENRQKLIAKIKESEGRELITRAVDAFLARYPKLPDDFEVLTKVLAHRDDERVREGLAQLAELVGREKPRRGRTLAAQLRFLEDTHTDPTIRKLAGEVHGKL